MIETDLFDPGEPHEHLDDTIDIEWVDKRQAVAGFLRVSVRPSAGATWFLAVVHEQGEDPVVVLDFASLYPSIMLNYNLSHDTLLTGPRDDVPWHKTPNGFYFVTDEHYTGTLVTLLHKLLGERRRVKKLMKAEEDGSFEKELLDAKQLALKVTCNSIYGKFTTIPPFSP